MRARYVVASAVAIGTLLSMGMPIATSQVEDTPATAAGPDAELSARVDRLIRSADSLKGARVGVFARVLGAANPLVAHNDGEGFNSASNTKIATAAAALSLLGPQYTFTTGLWGAGLSKDGASTKTLFMVGGGDPSLGIDHVDGLARDLVATGLREVVQISIDDSFFDSDDQPRHYDEQPNEQAAFRAPVNAAGLGFNGFAVQVVPNPKGTGRATIILDPPVDYLNVVESAVSTVRRGRARIRLETKPRKGRLEIRIRGQIRVGVPRRIRRRVAEPKPFASSVLRWSLKRAGVKVRSRAHREGDVPPGARLLVARRSEALAVLVRGLGKYSNNYMAETLLKTIGAERDGTDAPASWDGALEAVRGFLVSDVGLVAKSFVYENGSGLFKSNRFKPAQIAKILEHAALDPRSGPEFVASLAIGGVDGTLRSRMDGITSKGTVRAKTGTLAKASALSGFATVGGAAPVVFSILINEVPAGEIDAARKLQDAIAEVILEHSSPAR